MKTKQEKRICSILALFGFDSVQNKIRFSKSKQIQKTILKHETMQNRTQKNRTYTKLVAPTFCAI